MSATDKSAAAGTVGGDTWVLAESEEEGVPLILRLRAIVPVGVSVAAYPKLVSLYWPYPGEDTGGLPPSPVLERMLDLEKRLDVIEGSENGYMMACITGNGRREWLWQVPAAKIFMSALNGALGGVEPFPLRSHCPRIPTGRPIARSSPPPVSRATDAGAASDVPEQRWVDMGRRLRS